MSVRISEITPRRIYDAISRRLEDIPHSLLWYFSGGNNRHRLTKYKNMYTGKRCFIICNGPSLKKLDLHLLRNEITFGMNRIYLLFEELGFNTTYYLCSNELVIEQFRDDIAGLKMPKFLNWNRRNLFVESPENFYFKIRYGLNYRFNQDITQRISGCGTVTYVCLQLAYYMGFQEVVIIGADHDFTEKGTPNTFEVRTESEDRSHFHPNYFPKGVKWQFPDLHRSEVGYRLAREAFEADGRKIYNATAGGKLEIFERLDYLSFFNPK